MTAGVASAVLALVAAADRADTATHVASSDFACSSYRLRPSLLRPTTSRRLSASICSVIYVPTFVYVGT